MLELRYLEHHLWGRMILLRAAIALNWAYLPSLPEALGYAKASESTL